jgi:hypothetical protein
VPNPLAFGVTLGGLLLDVVAPRPKPRLGCLPEPSLLSWRADPRTPLPRPRLEKYDGHALAGGRHAGP